MASGLRTESDTDGHPFDLGWRERALVLGSLGLLLLVLFFLGKRYWPQQLVELIGLIPVTFVAVGKFLPLWAISGKSSMGPYELGAVIWALDTFTVIMFVYLFELFYKLRPLRRALDRIHGNMQLVLRAYPRIKSASVAGVVLLVLFPISGTGALAASTIGILVGMNRFVLMIAVSAGGFIGGLLMSFLAANFASALRSWQSVQDDPNNQYWIMAGLALVVALLLFFLNRAFRRVLAEAEEGESSGGPATIETI